jgi:hypothetical protein
MSTTRAAVPGATRTCPHCRTTVLERAVKCPQCQKHLRHDPDAHVRAAPSVSPFRVEGTIVPPPGDTWEYNLLVVVRNAKGEEVTRQLVEVGALPSGEARSFSLAVEVLPGTAVRRR